MVFSPLFVGPVAVLLASVLAIGLILILARLVVGLAWKLVVVSAVVLALLWLLGMIGPDIPMPV